MEYPNEPVLNTDGEPCWLTIKYEKVSTATNLEHTKMIQLIEHDEPLIDMPVFTLKNQYTYQCNKCGNIFINKLHAPEICPEDQGGCERPSTFIRLHDEIMPDLWSIPRWEDIVKMEPKQMYEDILDLTKNLIVFNNPIEYKIFTLWTISTWKLENWDTVAYPCFIGPPNSGKSTALRLISRLGYRAPKASGIKQAAVPRLCHYWNVTLLIDEAHDKLNSRSESGAEMLAFIKDSYKRGSVYITCDNNDQKKFVVTRNFGFKSFAGERSFKPSVLSRAIVFLMDKATPPIVKFSYAEKDIQRLQTQLLNYRFKTDMPPDIGEDFVLKGRTREIFESIIATAKHIGITIDDLIEYAKERDNEIEEELRQSTQYEILEIIKKYVDNPQLLPDIDRIDLKDVLNDIGWDAAEGIELKKNKQRLGYIIRDLGLHSERSGRIRYLSIEDKRNKKRFPQLFKRYNLLEKQEKLNTL